jgi:hypothetical protein
MTPDKTEHVRDSRKAGSGEADSSVESKGLVVFSILRDSQCAECLRELLRGEFLFMEAGRALCLSCADLDHLVYLPRGDTALTRRARKHSALSAVVVRFSRARGRYERQGVLIEEAALDQAEEECHADAAERRTRRQHDAFRRAEQDRKLCARMTEAIYRLFPGCPVEEARAIAAHASVRGSGRVGRTSAGRELETEALTAAVVAAIRHKHTAYDRLLMRGYSRVDARDDIRDEVQRILGLWRQPLSR